MSAPLAHVSLYFLTREYWTAFADLSVDYNESFRPVIRLRNGKDEQAIQHTAFVFKPVHFINPDLGRPVTPSGLQTLPATI
jgi:hypothetical protein